MYLSINSVQTLNFELSSALTFTVAFAIFGADVTINHYYTFSSISASYIVPASKNEQSSDSLPNSLHAIKMKEFLNHNRLL